MSKIYLFLPIVLLLFIGRTNGQSINPKALDAYVQKVMEDFQVPGISIGIVQNDSILYSKGFGLREKGKSQNVDVNTTFGIGSISKSFTALTVGLLVDEGLIKWDDPVQKYLPYFELYDPYVSENLTIRDLLTHKSGLKSVSGGTLWYHSDLSRTDIIKGLKHLKPASGFREKSAYQNVMFVVAGEIVSVLTNMPWDDYLESRLLTPLQMKNTTSRSNVRESNSNIARPHIWNEAVTDKEVIIQELGDNLAAAGFIYSSTSDMINYMRLLLNDGIFANDTIASKSIVDEIFTPQTLFQISSPPFGNEFSSYGLGWWLTPYKGHKIIEHSGGIDGMTAQLFMIKDLNFGVTILSNTSKEPAAFLIKSKILEMMFEDSDFDIYERASQSRQARIARMQAASQSRKQISGTNHSLEHEDYVGTYNDKMYGDINIRFDAAGELELTFSHTPLFTGKLSHWHFDTFKIDWKDIRVPDGFLTFNFDVEQKILGFTITQDNLLDVDFGELEILRKK